MFLFLHFVFPASIAAVVVKASSFTCEGKTVLSSSFIGQNSEVKVDTFACSNTIQKRNIERRQTNVCDAACTTNCFTPSGGGPKPYDCQVISDALLYDSQNVGALFNILTLYMQYSTFETFFVKQASYNETYCNTDWAEVVEYVAFNCQSTQNAHGGNCVATDQAWFIQVQTVRDVSLIESFFSCVR